jgi:N-acetylglucosamine-6-phosphate deacetylase
VTPARPPADLAVTGGSVLTPVGWVAGDVRIAGGRIVGAGPSVGMVGRGPAGPHGRGDQGTVGAGAQRAAVATSVIDAAGCRVVPGFVDLQCNGAAGIDLQAEPERLWEVAAALPRWGVTAWLPTIVSGPPEVRARALAALRAGPPPAVVAGAGGRPPAVPLGLHLEGPFLNPARRGAHPARWLAAPDPAVAAAEGWVVPGAPGAALVTLAPELPGAPAVVSALVAAGVAVAAGHSTATAAEARAGIDAGIGYVTHLFNGMVGLHHRDPGLPGVALSDDRVRVGLIADGVHVDPAVVAIVARAVGDRLSLVTDAVAALGTGGGSGARLADGTLAGGTVGLDGMVRNLVAFAGVPLEAAVAAVTTVPAGVLGLDDRGALIPEAVADVVVLDAADRVVATVVAGVPWVSPAGAP